MGNLDRPDTLETRLKAEAVRLGFSLSGIAPATEADGFTRFRRWLDAGYAGEMDYLHNLAEERRHPRSILDNVKSVLMLGLEYRDAGKGSNAVSRQPREDRRYGRVAAYAQGPDYHRFVWDRINLLATWLQTEVPGCRTEAVADTAPLLERDFARRAGLGWVGKNTMLLNPRRGSFFFLAAVLTDLELDADEPFAGSHCGTCTACLDACPTEAFPEPFVLDATRCISYLTIELRSPIPDNLRPRIGEWIYGCDVCQDVCPWNRKPSPGPVPFPGDSAMEWLDPIELLGLSVDAFRARFKKTSLFRNRRAGLLRNAAIVLGNVGDERAIPALERATADEEPLVREAACWAIQTIRARRNTNT
jgi:epoxyqueuosine reductase